MDISSCRLRRAKSPDTRALSALGRTTFKVSFEHLYSPSSLQNFLEETRSQDAYAALISSRDHAIILAETASTEIIGYILCGPMELPVDNLPRDARQLERLYIHPDHQSGGIGQLLLDAAIDWAKREAATALYLGVYSENLGAQRFYARAGFEVVGEYGFKVGDHTDREFIMALML